MQKLKVKTALITGGSAGMRYAAAQHFLHEGARIMMTERNENSVNQTVILV